MVGTETWSSSHWPAFPAVWKVQRVALDPEISCGVVQCFPPSSLWVSMIGDSTYSPWSARNAVHVT
jgi:hypothetical protein